MPGSLEEFDGRLCRTVLSPLSPLLRGARYLLAEGRCALACFGAAGFSDALRAEAAARGDVLLLGLDALYG
ncbi:hypothetical protein [Kitasatospora mediocidica]|uniref:hypothetical protein n=1 Tax=Kitasatospora mediocidica TaxID=58352 RepID=UPI00055EF909|nr:hypothetical protein [Kitasatospora mediocidica]